MIPLPLGFLYSQLEDKLHLKGAGIDTFHRVIGTREKPRIKMEGKKHSCWLKLRWQGKAKTLMLLEALRFQSLLL